MLAVEAEVESGVAVESGRRVCEQGVDVGSEEAVVGVRGRGGGVVEGLVRVV